MLRFISFFFLFSNLSCHSNEPKTLITEKPLIIDRTVFKTIEHKFNCNVDRPSPNLGGLTPKLPIVEISSFDFNRKCIWQSKGMMPICNNLVVQIKDTLTLIDTEEKFKKLFTPVDNEQEAISFISYLTRTYPKYDISKKLRYRVYSDNFPSTYVKAINDGYEVILHDKKVFGCGPHPYFYKIYQVTKAGHITLIKTVKMFEDPEEDAHCVD